MSGLRAEDRDMKIPALLHLMRLGYTPVFRSSLLRDPVSNILPRLLQSSLQSIHGVEFSTDAISSLVSDLNAALLHPDQGSCFYEYIRNGWNGLRLVDFDRPERNSFHVGTEIPCISGRSRFQPDLTLFLNGLPLAMIEVKTARQKEGILAEYNRMRQRLRREEFRPFLQAAQVWSFSNDHFPDTARLLPTEGAYYAAVLSEDFPIYAFQPSSRASCHGLCHPDRAAELAVLRDLGASELLSGPGFRSLVSPLRPTHQMLTALFQPHKWLFMLRYGIVYHQAESSSSGSLQKNLLTLEQLSLLKGMEVRIQRGYLNWSLPQFCGGAQALLTAASLPLIRDHIPGAQCYWVSASKEASLRARLAFRSFPSAARSLRFLSADQPDDLLFDASAPGQRVFFLPAASAYMTGRSLASLLRRADPHALLIFLGESCLPENVLPSFSLSSPFRPFLPLEENHSL